MVAGQPGRSDVHDGTEQRCPIGGSISTLPSRLFVPSPDHVPSEPRIDSAEEIRDVLAVVALHTPTGKHDLVIGLDLGRVMRVVAARPGELPARARAQVAHHETKRPRFELYLDELHVMDVQAIERQPDAPGADDPLYLYGMMRGPYPAALRDGVVAREGQLATTRGPLLDGLALGIERSFAYESGYCGARCAHLLLPIDGTARAAVLAFPLVPMGDDGTNEIVAAQLVHDVLGAMRSDLGDDLANDPVPVPDRRRYEQELAAAGWTVRGDIAVHRGGKSRLASLFSPAKQQKLPEQATLDEYVPLIRTQLARLPGWPEARTQLHEQLGDHGPRRTRPPTSPSSPPRPPRRPPSSPGLPSHQAAPFPPPRGPGPLPGPPPFTPRARRSSPAAPRTVAKGLEPDLAMANWMKRLVDQHRDPERPPPHVTVPGRAAGASVPDWMLDLIEDEFPDD